VVQLEAAAGQGGPKAKEVEEELGKSKAKVEYLQEQVIFLKDQADKKFQEGMHSQDGLISELRARIAQLEKESEESRKAPVMVAAPEPGNLEKKLAELSKKDAILADRMMKAFDSLTRKINSLKPGGVDTEVEYTPNQFVLENLLKEELESNIPALGAKTASATTSVEDRLAKLRSVRSTIGGSKDEGDKAEEKKDGA
jgi:predicted nuclease with TOPRIM domain